MATKPQNLTPKKRSHEEVSYSRRVYRLKILLPDGTTSLVKIPQTMDSITVRDLAGRVRKEHERKDSNLQKHVNWNAQLCFIDDSDHVFRSSLKLTNLELNRVYNLRLDVSPCFHPMDTQMDYRSVQCQTPETNASSVQDLYYYDFQSDLRSCLNFEKDLKNEICDLGLKIAQHEDKIKQLECQKRTIESELLELEGENEIKYGSPGKNEIIARVELMTDSAASVVMELLKEDSDTPLKSIIGVVALLGTTRTLELSRIFAEYLGDQMLAVVCKCYEDVRLLEAYKKNGRLNRERALHMFAAELGKSVIGRYHVLCIEDISACKVHKDLEGKLLLPNPTLPNGATPAGFLGYAVNMIDIDADHVDTRTDSGFCLRETLFYRLFGEAQVYKTRKDMKNAISCIKDGAVSLDGGILRGNGAMSLGFWEPDIIFPIAASGGVRNEQVLQRYAEMKLKLEETMKELLKEKKCLESVMKKFKKRRYMYAKYFTQDQPTTSSSSVEKYNRDGSHTPAYCCK